ncbi:hypothetical protein OJJOAM_001339 [Cupriavidus sp. H18C1]
MTQSRCACVQFGPRRVARNAGARGVAHQVVLALLPCRRLHRLDRALAQRLAPVGNDQAEVDADHAAEAAAGLAGAVGRVEREQRRLRVCIAQVAFRTVQAGGEAPDGRFGVGGFRGVALGQHVDIDPAGAAFQRGLDRLDHAGLVGALQAEAVGHHVEHLARAGRRVHHPLRLHAGVAADRQPLRDLVLGRGLRQLDGEGHRQARIAVAGAFEQLGVDGLGGVVAHRQRGLAVEQLGRAREQQLQVVVQLGHGADRRARAAHRIGLVDRDRRRHALDALDLRAVHAIEELAGVGAEGLDIAPLPFGIEGVEDQAGFAGAGRTRDHRHFAGAQVQIDLLEIVLTRAADADDAGRHGGILSMAAPRPRPGAVESRA